MPLTRDSQICRLYSQPAPRGALADQIELLAPQDVAHAAAMLAMALATLSGYDLTDPEQAEQMRQMATYNEAFGGYTRWRNRFLAAAKADLGTGSVRFGELFSRDDEF